MTGMAVLTALAALATPEVEAVRLTTIDHRPALRILGSDDLPPAEVVREAGEVVIRLAGTARPDLALPAPERPLEAIGVERGEGTTVLRIKVAAEVPFEAGWEAGMLTVVFGLPPGPEQRGPVTPELYRQLFPTGGPLARGQEAQPEVADRREGWVLGRMTVWPYITVSWVDADVLGFGGPEPVRDQYLQVQPGLVASLPVARGLAGLEYEPRLRFFSDIPQVNETSHFAGAKLELPLGSRSLLRAGYRFSSALLETTVVDPGREYFSDLARFTFNEILLGARVEVGPRLWLALDGGGGWTRFDKSQPGGFLDDDVRTARAEVGYDVGNDVRVTLGYGYERIPPSPDRALIESTAHSILAGIAGPVGPLTTTAVTVGFRSQRNPLAEAGADRFQGLTLAGLLQRDLGAASRIELVLGRATEPSNFEDNAFYVSNSALLALSTDAPLRLRVQASAGWRWNEYRADASAIGRPREDQIFGWSLGVSRSLGSRTWLRADYRRERRDSSVPGYDVTTDGFVAQVGYGLFAPAGARP